MPEFIYTQMYTDKHVHKRTHTQRISPKTYHAERQRCEWFKTLPIYFTHKHTAKRINHARTEHDKHLTKGRLLDHSSCAHTLMAHKVPSKFLSIPLIQNICDDNNRNIQFAYDWNRDKYMTYTHARTHIYSFTISSSQNTCS